MQKRLFAVIIIFSLCLSTAPCISAFSDTIPSVSAKSAIAIEAESKDIIFEKSCRERLPMASTTKIMTALVVLEALPLDRVFTIAESAVGTEGTSAYLETGDRLTVEAALYALLLQSANDVAVGLAIEAGGSIEGFCVMMNEKAKELGLSDTSFANPSGLPDDSHYTTAYDLARLGAVCLENPDFARIVSTKSATVKINGKDRTFVNHNKLLSLYEGTVGIKTGFTKESGRCLVGACRKDGVTVVTVTLSASNDWNDHISMFDYAFSQYTSYTLCKKGEFLISVPVAGTGRYVSISPKKTVSVSLKKGSEIRVYIEHTPLVFSPVQKGDTVGYANFTSEGKIIARVPLYSLNTIR